MGLFEISDPKIGLYKLVVFLIYKHASLFQHSKCICSLFCLKAMLLFFFISLCLSFIFIHYIFFYIYIMSVLVWHPSVRCYCSFSNLLFACFIDVGIEKCSLKILLFNFLWFFSNQKQAQNFT